MFEDVTDQWRIRSRFETCGWRIFVFATSPDGYVFMLDGFDEVPEWALEFYDEETECIAESPEFIKAAVKSGIESRNGQPLYYETWDTEGVWRTREEANDYGTRRSYNYPDGWRVHPVPAEGELAQRLRNFTEATNG